MKRLHNKVILVTGSNFNIGLATVKLCLSEGAKVVLHARTQSESEQAVAELTNNNVHAVWGDLTQPDIAQTLIDKTVAHFDTIDGLVNNASVFPRTVIDEVNEDNFSAIFNVNTRAPLLLARAAIEQFRQQKSAGTIVNIGSLNAHCGQNDLLIYSMSKGALQTMTRNLADALGIEHIRVNQLNVGWTHTNAEHQVQLAQGKKENWFENLPVSIAPFGRILTPEQVARHVLFWLSDESYPISGQVYEVEQYPLIGRNHINKVI